MKYILLSLILLVGACVNYDMTKEKNLNKTVDAYLDKIPKYASFIINPADTILLGFSKSTTNTDTAWTLFLVKQGQDVNCIYHHILPYTVSGFDGYLDESKELLFYEGFNFKMKQKEWDSLVHLSGLNSFLPKDTLYYTGCPHCPNYLAYYDSKIIVSGQNDKTFLVKLDSILHVQLLNSIFSKRMKPTILFNNK